MASITSEEKKMLYGSDPSDLDYILMDFDDNDLDLDVPSSPVLHRTFNKKGKQEDHSASSSSQPLKMPSFSKSDENNNVTTNSKADNASKTKTSDQNLASTQPIRRTPVSPCLKRKRPIQLRSQAKNISPVRALSATKENVTQNTAGLQNCFLTPVRKQEETNKKKRGLTNRGKGDICNTNIADEDSDNSDVISLYARDEDYSSLYTNNAMKEREVTIDNTNRPTIVNGANPPVPDLANKADDKKDLRYKIPKKCPDDIQGLLMTKISNLLDCDTRSNTLLAAAKFCSSYTGNQFKKVNREFYCITRKLAEKLLHYQEMRHLYRIVRLALDMQIVITDSVLCGLINHLGKIMENAKIAVIMNVIREKHVMCGDIVQVVANKYLLKKKPEPQFLKIPQIFRNTTNPVTAFNRIVSKENDVALVNGGISGGMQHCSDNCIVGNKPVTSAEENSVNKILSPGNRRNVIRASTFCGPVENWKKDPVFIQISNSRKVANDAAKNEGVSCNFTVSQTRKRVLNYLNGANITVDPKHDLKGTMNGLPNTTGSDINVNMLGKCIGHIVEAVGDTFVPNTLFSAFADLLALGDSERESSDMNFDVCEKLVPFLKSALNSSSGTSDTSKINFWVSRIGADMIQRLSPNNAYRMAQSMKYMGLNLVPPSLGKSRSHAERKIRFQIVNKIVGYCISEKDLNLSISVIQEYFADENASDAGPVFAPLLCTMLCNVAKLAITEKQFLKAAKCLSMLPAGFGDRSEFPLMDQVLIGVLTDTNQHTQEEINICNGMVEQMLSRGMATSIRAAIVNAFCPNVVPLFKHLEAKGVYRRPRIAECPYVIMIPYILCIQEMALVVQRHLTELSEYLLEMNQRIQVDRPMRIVLGKNIGFLQPLSSIDDTNKQKSYEQGLQRLLGALDGYLNPNLKVMTKELHPQKTEFVLQIDICSVRHWMLANTEYEENKKLMLHAQMLA
ncbi:uncharacterized protein LOC144425108 [Styela clava]